MKEQNLPELDDEFAKSVGDGYESFASLREAIQEQLNNEAIEAETTRFREAAIEEVQKISTVELPPLLIEREVENMVDRRDRFAERLNMTKEDYLRFTGKTEEEIQKEMREQAIDRLGRSWVLVNLAESEGLDVSVNEIDEKIQALNASGDDVNESRQDIDLNSDVARKTIREMLIVEKALGRLTDIAKGQAMDSSQAKAGSSKQDKDSDKMDDDS